MYIFEKTQLSQMDKKRHRVKIMLNNLKLKILELKYKIQKKYKKERGRLEQ